MLNLERILKQGRPIRALAGLNWKAFEELLPSFTDAYEQSRINWRKDDKTLSQSQFYFQTTLLFDELEQRLQSAAVKEEASLKIIPWI
jgi:hypothetical protein